MAQSERPLPVPDALSAPYWQAAAQHVLALAKCGQCATFCHPPDTVCPACGSIEPKFASEPVSGKGRVRSWTVVRQALLPGFDREVPYVVVDVELDEQAGLRMTGRLLDGPEAQLALNMSVGVEFEDLADGVSVPAFRLVTA